MRRNKMLLKKLHSDSYSLVLPGVKKYIDLCFSHSLHQLIMEPTSKTESSKILIDHILTNSPENVIESGITEMRLSDGELIYYSQKATLLKLNENQETSFRSIKNYSYEMFVDKLSSKKFSDYLNHTRANDAYQDFVTEFLSAVDSVSSVRTLRVKSDFNALNTVRTRNKRYKNMQPIRQGNW